MMRFYRALLHLYPAAFRNEYREELCRAFAEHARGLSASAIFVAAIMDVVPNAVGAHWENIRYGVSGGLTLPTVGSDIRFAVRQIARAPLFSGVVIVVIALGIGINAGLLTTLNTYAWRPAPGIEPDAKLARLTPTAVLGRSNQQVDALLSYPDILDLREQRDVVTEVAAWEWARLAADFGNGAESVSASYTTANFFRVLRVHMAAGTGFPGGVDQSSAPIAVIGHSLWMSNFGGSPTAIGKTVRVMNQPFVIVGVAPPGFVGVNVSKMGSPSIWIPLGARAMLESNGSGDLTRRDGVFLRSVARLAPGVSPSDVGRRTSMLAARLAREEPTAHRGLVIGAERLTGMPQTKGDTKELVVGFFLVAALIVVITCTNVSALLLGRAVARRREIGVRLSLGASRLRIVRQMLTEALVFALAGGLLGLLLYGATVKLAYATIPDVIYPGLQLQPATFLYAALFAVVTTIAFGLAPALHATRTDVGEVIKNSGTLAIRRSRLQAMFVVVQLACSQPVLVVTSLVLADIRNDMNTNADMAPASVVTMYSELVGPGNVVDSSPTASRGTLDLVRRRIEDIPGVQSAAISMSGRSESFEVPSGATAIRMSQVYATAGYFSTLGIPLVRGRAIGSEDELHDAGAVVINEAAATLMWPGEDPIGKRLVRRSRDNDAAVTTFEVIGVAGVALYDEDRETPMVFAPLSAASIGQARSALVMMGSTRSFAWGATIAVRTSGDARSFMPRIRGAIREIQPLATVGDAATLAEQYADRQREAVQANLAAFAVGAAALALASLGLYAIIAFAVAQRTREIGVRLAIGASSSDIVRHFFRDGLKVTATGLAIGLPVTVAGIRVVQANLLGFTLQNVAAVMLVVPVLIVIAALASWLPARRAGRVDPLVALRSE